MTRLLKLKIKHLLLCFLTLAACEPLLFIASDSLFKAKSATAITGGILLGSIATLVCFKAFGMIHAWILRRIEDPEL